MVIHSQADWHVLIHRLEQSAGNCPSQVFPHFFPKIGMFLNLYLPYIRSRIVCIWLQFFLEMFSTKKENNLREAAWIDYKENGNQGLDHSASLYNREFGSCSYSKWICAGYIFSRKKVVQPVFLLLFSLMATQYPPHLYECFCF